MEKSDIRNISNTKTQINKDSKSDMTLMNSTNNRSNEAVDTNFMSQSDAAADVVDKSITATPPQKRRTALTNRITANNTRHDMARDPYSYNEEKIVKEFKKFHDVYEAVDQAVAEKLEKLVEENNFFIMEITHRVKAVRSLKNKLDKKHGKYKKLKDITDLCGARIICYFNDTVDNIAKVMDRYFVIDKKNSIDKRTSLSDNQFGYLSLHFIVSLRPWDGYSREMCSVRCEIQIRTVLQHAWAEIEHDLGYKSEFGVPRPVRREFSRIAGLLELADEQFISLRQNVKKYEDTIKARIVSGDCLDLALDNVTLREFIEHNTHFQQQLKDMMKRLGVDYFPNPVERYLKRLDWLKFKKIGDFIDSFNTNQHRIEKIIHSVCEEYGLDFVTTSMMLDAFCNAELLTRKYPVSQIADFMYFRFHDKQESMDYTQRFMHKMKYLFPEFA